MTAHGVERERRRRDVEALYQPIVRLDSAEVVGFEALARWVGGAGGSVGDDFVRAVGADGDATTDGDRVDLDWACRAAALVGAMDAGIDDGYLLFVNVEPSVLGRAAPPGFADILARARAELRVVVELTERELLARPRELLSFVDWVREQGWGLALDDVGPDTDSVAALPLLDPDFVKLDMSLVQQAPTPESARTMTALLAHHERSGATLLAEGIENEEHLEQARCLGAELGQGWLFGRPGPLVGDGAPQYPVAAGRRRPELRRPVRDDPAATPAALLDAAAGPRIARKPVLLALTRQLEQQARNAAERAVVLATFQREEWLTPATRRRYADLAGVCRFVGLLGSGLPAEPVAGARGVDLPEDDPLTDEWIVVVVGSHYAGALVAREVPSAGPPVADAERRFEFFFTHDRSVVADAARSLLRRFGADTTPR